MSWELQRTSRRNFEPSIGVLGVMRFACCLFVGMLCSLSAAASASADDVLVLGRDGHIRPSQDRALPATTLRSPPVRRGHAVATAARKPKKKPKRTVTSELKRLLTAGAITRDDYTARRAVYLDARRKAKKLAGTGRTQMTAVVRLLDDMAARK